MSKDSETEVGFDSIPGLRQLDPDRDLELLIGHMQRCKAANKSETTPTVEQMRRQFQTPGIDITGNLFVVQTRPEMLDATASAIPIPGADGYHIQTHVGILPELRSSTLADDLMRFIITHAKNWIQTTGNTGTLQSGARTDQEYQVELIQRHGFVPIRYFHTLERDLEEPIQAAIVPEDIAIRAISIETEAEALHLTMHEAFQDHFNPVNFTLEQTVHWATSPEFEDGVILMAFELDRHTGQEVAPAAVCMNLIRKNYNLENGKQEGCVQALGVRRAYRRKGIARAILTRSLVELKAAGMTTAMLSVDSENPLGATDLYASVGFRPRKTDIIYEIKP